MQDSAKKRETNVENCKGVIDVEVAASLKIRLSRLENSSTT